MRLLISAGLPATCSVMVKISDPMNQKLGIPLVKSHLNSTWPQSNSVRRVYKASTLQLQEVIFTEEEIMPHFNNIPIWPPFAMDNHSNQEVIFTEEEIIYLRNLIESNQDMPQGCQLISSGSGEDIGNNSQGNHQLVVGAQPWGMNKISSPAVKVRKYMKFSPEEIEKLILGVQKYGRSWKSIKLDYFKDSPRTENKLMEKWRHMLKSADKQTDPILKELYMRAKNVDAALPNYSRSRSFGR